MSTRTTPPESVPTSSSAAGPTTARTPPPETAPTPATVERDRLFAAARARIDDFDFGRQTAAVFDDMLHRSVPMYVEIQRMVASLAVDFAKPGSRVYDLGCSTGASLIALSEPIARRHRDVGFVGIDSSPEMLSRARANLMAADFPHELELTGADLNGPIDISNASVVLLVLTLQFVRPLHRDQLLQTIYRGMNTDGCLIVVEKVLGEDSTLNRLFIEHYYEFKRRNGYSDLEIAQKREALENVLVPYRLDENRNLLARAGFRSIDVFFKWFNFCGLVAVK